MGSVVGHPSSNRVLIYTDGGSDGNDQGYIGIGIIEKDTEEIVYGDGHAIGQATNNEAEYSALIAALYVAQEMGATDVEVNCDSKLVVNQVNGTWQVHKNHLQMYVEEVLKEKEKFDRFEVKWIPRRENKLADALSRQPR